MRVKVLVNGENTNYTIGYDTLSAIVYIICPLCPQNYEQLLVHYITLDSVDY